MGSLKQRYEQFAEFMQHNTKGVEVIANYFIIIFFGVSISLYIDFIACKYWNVLCASVTLW